MSTIANNQRRTGDERRDHSRIQTRSQARMVRPAQATLALSGEAPRYRTGLSSGEHSVGGALKGGVFGDSCGSFQSSSVT
jgi:hypothetical protein